MKILGLDLSLTATGLVLVAGDELEPEAGVEVLRTETLRPGHRRGVERLVWLAELIRTVAAPHGSAVDMAAIEGYAYSRTNQAHQLGELGGVVRVTLHLAHVPFVEVQPGTWRKQLLGHGSLKKELVPRELFKRYGVDEDSVDELEAYAVALAAFRTACGLDMPAPKSRRRNAS